MRLPIVAVAVLAMTAARAEAGEFRLTSPSIGDGGPIAQAQVFSGSGCGGDNRSPALSWSGVPAGAKSLAVTVFDPDAPTGNGWWHWVVFNLPPGATGLPAGAGDPKLSLLPEGAVQTHNDFGRPGYGGPCPPPGARHRYVFTVYALRIERLSLDSGTPSATAHSQLAGYALGTASLTGLYGR